MYLDKLASEKHSTEPFRRFTGGLLDIFRYYALYLTITIQTEACWYDETGETST